jgi:hypothetical protein
MNEPNIDPDRECFFIAPIGSDGSEIRKRSDGVRDYIVKPAMAEFGLSVLRADDLKKPGQITLQVIEHVYKAKACVVDLTGRNANVYYEMAVRHTARLPVVLIIEVDELDDLPFDIQQMRVISFSHTDLASAARAKDEIVAQMREAFDGEVDSPIGTVLNLQALTQGTSVERTLADLVTRVDSLAATTNTLAKEVRSQRTEVARQAEVEGYLADARRHDRDVKRPHHFLGDLLSERGIEYVIDVTPEGYIVNARRGEFRVLRHLASGTDMSASKVRRLAGEIDEDLARAAADEG